MNNKDFFDIEDQIENALNSAFKYINYANRKATDVRNNVMNNLNNTAEDTINDIKEKFQGTTYELDKKFQSISQIFEEGINKGINKLSRKEQKEQYKYIAKNPAGKYKGMIYNVLGIIGCVGFAVSFGACSLLTMFNSSFIRFGVNMTLGTLFVFFAGSLFLALKGAKIRKRTERFNKYSDIIKGKNYCEINTLADAVSKKNKFVLKDLENMMDLEMFKEGYISDDKTYFMLGSELYNEYINSVKSYEERSKEENEDKRTNNNNEKNELSIVIENGEKYISQIESVNYSLRGNNICTKLNEMTEVTRNIIDNVKKNPDNLPIVKKFFNHYLPISLKLINSYKELSDQTIEGENIIKAKTEIEKSIDLINTAFKKLLDKLFEDVVLDVTSDISVLETLFSQEGLTEDQFKKKR
ncbi:5-bromo-4-chloroindolyl phosphate hydrolysis family protein [uncultured Clostridium sp.]|uniref:5-bromo-4-chloroindolyl phosphate hydrolysis family protein n=1 Tax=uncultured Clostridium sp. TaxID=59620 RepID=UPI0025DA2B04|nr:5-bromo-4-chloroindolyl phosphate hydrolysis family protein [uncultured Clostridium sp.]